MQSRPALFRLAPAVLLLAAAGAWVFYDYRDLRREHLENHRRLGRALLEAFEGVVFRETRGGYYSKEELAETLAELRPGFGARWLAVRAEDGTILAEAGRKSESPELMDPLVRFEQPFTPIQPRGAGRGRGQRQDLIRLPAAAYTLILVMGREDLDHQLDSDRQRALVMAGSIGVALFLLAGIFLVRIRALSLRADLDASRQKLNSLDYLRRLGAGLVHETKNPLGVVRGFAERIIRAPLDEEQLRLTARAILEETDRTTARLDEFLLLSRPAELRRRRFRLGELFEELALLLDPDLKSKGVGLELDCGAFELDADREQIRRLFMNLLLNAIQASEPGGRISVTCRPLRDGLRIEVGDEGLGVPPELWDTLFEPYVSGRPGGTGLGLSIARRIALDHGFELRYEPNHPRGTRLIVEVKGS